MTPAAASARHSTDPNDGLARIEREWVDDAFEALRGRPAASPAPGAGHWTRKFAAPLARAAGASIESLKAAWPEIVGPRIAALSAPERLSRHGDNFTLTIKVETAAAALLQHQIAQIRERVNLACGTGVVSEIKLLHGAVAKRAARAEARQAFNFQRPLAPDLDQRLRAELADIENPVLREALYRIGIGVHQNAQRPSVDETPHDRR